MPVKDLFGAIFFVSVGMLVNPSVLLQYAWPVVIITLVTLVGKSIFSSLGVLLSGEPLKVSVKSGFSLAQIGEFAFIIAGLGASLKVLDPFVPPIIVAVSVITTFTTPYLSGWQIRFPNGFIKYFPLGPVNSWTVTLPARRPSIMIVTGNGSENDCRKSDYLQCPPYCYLAVVRSDRIPDDKRNV